MDSRDVKAFFEQVSLDWDEMRSSFYNADVIDALVEKAEIGSETAVVDVGTGTGFVAAGLAARALMVIGVDNSSAMLAVARANLATFSVNNVSLVEGPLGSLPLSPGSVDGAVANMVLHRPRSSRNAHRDGPRGAPRRQGGSHRRDRAHP